MNSFNRNKLIVFTDREECGALSPFSHGNSSPWHCLGLSMIWDMEENTGNPRKSQEIGIKSQLNPSSLLSLIIYLHPELDWQGNPWSHIHEIMEFHLKQRDQDPAVPGNCSRMFREFFCHAKLLDLVIGKVFSKLSDSMILRKGGII